MSYLPCENPNCKSYGRPHPNCRCHGGMAHGGRVERFCSERKPHQSGCEYFAQGGAVPSQDNPAETLGHAAIHHGLLGLLKNVGRANLAEPDRHVPILEDAKNHHEAHQGATGEEFRNTLGNRIGKHHVEGDHEGMAEKLHGHPLVGGVGKGNLAPILKRLSPELMERESNPAAMRGAVDYLHSSIRGSDGLKDTLKTLVGKGHSEIEPDVEKRESLKEFLKEVQEDPTQLIEVGGDLAHYLPDHGRGLGALAATAVDYLGNLKPKPTQARPLDEVAPVDRMAESKYNRALDIAAKPLLTLQHVRDGTLQPNDVNTLKTLYPGLYQNMVSQLGERLITAKSNGEEIPYRQKMAMSLLLGEPLDSTMTPESMQAIIASAGAQQAQKQADEAKKASAAELKQVNKVDNLYALPSERRQIDKKA